MNLRPEFIPVSAKMKAPTLFDRMPLGLGSERRAFVAMQVVVAPGIDVLGRLARNVLFNAVLTLSGIPKPFLTGPYSRPDNHAGYAGYLLARDSGNVSGARSAPRDGNSRLAPRGLL